MTQVIKSGNQKHNFDTEEEFEDDGTMVLDEETGSLPEIGEVPATDPYGTSSSNIPEVIQKKQHTPVEKEYGDNFTEDFIPTEATTVLDDEDFEDEDFEDEELGDEKSSSTQKLVEHAPVKSVEYKSPEFKNKSGQGMFSEEELQRMREHEERKRARENELLRQAVSTTPVASVLAKKLRRDPEEFKQAIYDDSETAALYYSESQESIEAEDKFMKELELNKQTPKHFQEQQSFETPVNTGETPSFDNSKGSNKNSFIKPKGKFNSKKQKPMQQFNNNTKPTPSKPVKKQSKGSTKVLIGVCILAVIVLYLVLK